MAESVQTVRVPVMARRRPQGTVINWAGRIFFVLLGLLLVYVLARDMLAEPSVFATQVVNGLQLGMVYALIALGYTMVYGIVKLINFAHGDVFMVGAFISFYCVARFGLHLLPGRLFPGMPPDLALGLGVLLVILVSMASCALLAVAIERFAYKPLRNAPRIAALITAIGVSFFLEYFGQLPFVFSANYITYERPFPVEPLAAASVTMPTLFLIWLAFLASAAVTVALQWLERRGNARAAALRANVLLASVLNFGMLAGGLLGIVLTLARFGILVINIMIVIMLASIFMLILLQYVVRQSKIGKAMRAAAFDKPTARLMGISVDVVISVTFAIGAAFAGMGGVLYATAYPQLQAFMGVIPGLKAFVAAVLGGIGSIPGAFVGALIMGQAEVISAAYISTPMRDVAAFTILIIVLIVRPTGIFGEPEGEKA
jgi:branched-chain amino acid transport system permease protein